MIDWIHLSFSFCWFLGFAILLATFSYHYWLAQTTVSSLRIQLKQPKIWQSIWSALSLVALGFAGTSDTWWEIAIWGILMVGSFYYAYESWQKLR